MDQVTALSLVPVTSAQNQNRSPGAMWIVGGWTTTVIPEGLEIVTMAIACSAGSATLCTTTCAVPLAAGAVYAPVTGSIAPASVEYRTRTSLNPATVVVNWIAAPGATVAVCGEIRIVRGGAGVTVATAVADFVGSAWLVATM